MRREQTESGHRLETGPVQFDSDWPGLFIRGDDAAGFAGSIARTLVAAQAAGVRLEPIDQIKLEELGELFQSAILRPAPADRGG